MTWDVPTDQDCPSCGQTMFKKSGRGRMTPFCINENCANFLPEDKRGYRKKTPKKEDEAQEPVADSGAAPTVPDAVSQQSKVEESMDGDGHNES